MKISQIMTSEVTAVTPDTPLKDVAAVLIERRISGVPVVEGERLLGIVSETDIVRKAGSAQTPASLLERLLRPDSSNRPSVARVAADVMTSPAVTIDAWRPVAAAAALMTDQRINRLPVTEDGRLVGIVTRSDLVRAFTRGDEEIEREVREDVVLRSFWASPDALTIEVEDGEVLVAGEVETETLADALPRAIARVPGVVTVKSELTYRQPERGVRLSASG
jgi:CBS domain-containing protein